jgi:hypothetical protein
MYGFKHDAFLSFSFIPSFLFFSFCECLIKSETAVDGIVKNRLLVFSLGPTSKMTSKEREIRERENSRKIVCQLSR